MNDTEKSLMEQLIEIKKQKSIKGPISHDIKTNLSKTSKKNLAIIAKKHYIKFTTKTTKQQLIEIICEIILNEAFFKKILLNMRDKEDVFFDTLVNEEFLVDNNFTMADIGYLMELGVVFSYYIDDKFTYILPKQLKSIYENIDNEEHTELKRFFAVVCNYCEASMNLYGILRIDVLLDNFYYHFPKFKENSEDTDKNTILSIIEILLERQQKFDFQDNYLRGDYFYLHDQSVLMSKIIASDKPYYLPERKQFFKHTSDLYLEEKENFFKMKKFIENNITNETKSVDDLLLTISYEAHLGSYKGVLSYIDYLGYNFKSDNSLSKFSKLYHIFCNDVRMWVYHGHTFNELNSNNSKNIKIGRNQLCPCGSGKKYKHCCMGK